MIGLTDEEIMEEVGLDYTDEPLSDEDEADMIDYRFIAEAQLKKVVEWGNEDCTDRTHSGTMKRRECGFCWQALSEEVKVSGDNDH